MSGGSDWRSASTTEHYADHDYADFAQEFLRRNPDYQRDYADMESLIAQGQSVEPIEMEGLAGRWGLRFPLKPR
jgi:hypothetical protein